MLQVLSMDDWPNDSHCWPSRFMSHEVLAALTRATSNQIVTDGQGYKSEKIARLLVDTYRRRLRKMSPPKMLQARIVQDADSWKWFARVIG